ncbi:MAG: type I glyceraldehyde-3-phosphate dehydrogenase [Alphaproteobacteria bacterium]
MNLRVAINGFGRIGRMVLRALVESKIKGVNVVAINDLGSPEGNTHLLKYDSVHGRFDDTHYSDDILKVGPQTIQVLAEPDPAKLPWRDLQVDIVLECSGRFTNAHAASAHITAGAKRVLISAPADGVDMTVVYGVNHQNLSSRHIIVSNGSCTTNCLAPVALVLQQQIGIQVGFMTTVHAYTADQRLVDTCHDDWHRSRAAALSMIPTSTGAAKALGLVIPELKGKLDGTAIRVPSPNVSLIDLSFMAERSTNVQEINQIMRAAAAGALKGVLSIVDEPLVSIDFNHHPASASFDTGQTQVVGDRFCRVLAWYDNEWGFANRMIDVAQAMGNKLN